ncbi:UNVERIFIED_CONTAM: hypothetical protein Scaly_0083200 [Sesamum calycinum]|uniref:Uncharacterized protein n=1 Tax=Sesamum calycinum TaxID=2727403 RepID=A0AAW2SX02_9LAMI
MMEYSFPTADGTISSIAKPIVQAQNPRLNLPSSRSSGQIGNHCMMHENVSKTCLKDVLIMSYRCDCRLERTDKRIVDTYNVDAITTLSTQMVALTQKVYNLGAAIWNGAPVGPCGLILTHTPTHIIRWHNHPNFSWSNNQGPLGNHQSQHQAPQEKKSNLEDMLSNFITATNTRFQNQDASIRNLKVQMGQLVSIFSGKKEGQLPSDTEKKSREQVNAITLESEKTIRDEPPKEQVEKAQTQKEEDP